MAGGRLLTPWASALLLGAAGCVTDLAVPAEAQITCESNAECPGKRACIAGRCIIPGDIPPAIVLESMGRTATTPVVIPFSLIDAEEEPTSVRFELFVTDWADGTIAEVHDADQNVVASPAAVTATDLPSARDGMAYTLHWDPAADGITTATTLRVRLTPENSRAGEPAETEPFEVGNDVPVVEDPVPRPSGDVGNIVFTISVSDSSSDLVTIEDGIDNGGAGPSIEFTRDGGATWLPADIIVGQLLDLRTSPAGETHRFTWNSAAPGNMPGESGNVRVRIFAADSQLNPTPATTPDFPIDNGNQPTLNWVRTLDDDSDGRIDFLVVSFNKNVSDTTFDPAVNLATSALPPAAMDPRSLVLETPPRLGSPSSTNDITDDSTVYVPLVTGGFDTDVTGRLDAGPGLLLGLSPTNPSAPITGAIILDTAAPALISLATADTDANGQLDTIDLEFSEALVGVGAMGWAVDGYTIAMVSTPAPERVRLQLQELTTPDTGVQPAVHYTQSAGGIVDAPTSANNPNPLLSFSQLADDGAAPVLVDALAVDRDGDGRIDAVEAIWSEDLFDPALAPDAHTLANLPGSATESSGMAAESELDGVVTVVVVGAPEGTQPFAITVSAASGQASDAAGNSSTASGMVAVRDGAGPVLLRAAAEDGDGNGELDRVRATYSEDLENVDGDEHTLGAIPAPFSAAMAAQAESSAGVVDTLLAGSALRTTPGAMTISVPNAAFADGAGNASVGTTDLPVIDGAGPYLESARALDTDGNGRIDRIDCVYTEPLRPASLMGNEHTVNTMGNGTVDSELLVGSTVQIVIANASVDTSAAGMTVAVMPGAVEDGAQNGNPNIAPATVTDGAGPVLVAAVTLEDAGAVDGVIDRIRLTFSEPFNAGTFDNDGHDLTLIPAPGTKGAESVQSATEIDIVVTAMPEGTGPVPTLVTVRPDELQDLAVPPNFNVSATLAVSDGAGPVLVGALVQDRSGNKRLDTITLSYSEGTAQASYDGDAHTYSPGAIGGSEASESRIDARTFEMVLTGTIEGTDPGSMSVSADPPELRDGSGNLAAAVTALAVRDGAGPRLVSHETGDADGNGRIDRIVMTFTEGVVVNDGSGADGLLGYVVDFPAYTIADRNFSVPPWHTGTDPTVTIEILEGPVPDTQEVPRVDALLAGTIEDASGNPQPAPDASTMSDDEASSVIVQALYDPGATAAVADDVLTVIFSEPVLSATIDGDGAGAHFSLSGSGAAFGAGATVTTAMTMTVTSAALSMGGAGASAPALGSSTIRIAGGSTMLDANSNPPDGNDMPATVEDADVPRIVTIKTLDFDRNGLVDHLVLEWTQAVKDSSYNPNVVRSSGFVLLGGGNPLTDGGGGEAMVGDVSDDEIQYVKVVEGTVPDTGALSAVNADTGLVLSAGDDDPSAAFVSEITIDDAGPVEFDAITEDTVGNDGQLDRITLRVSEDVDGDVDINDWTVAGRTLTSVTEASGVFTLSFNPLGSPDTGARPLVTYAPVGANELRDGAGFVLGGFSLTPADAVPPRLQTALLLDTQPDGNVDSVRLTFTESMNDASFTPVSGFTIGGQQVNGFDTDGGANNATVLLSVQVPFTELPGTGLQEVNYSVVGVIDTNGNPLAAIGNGFSEDDGAGPIPVGAAIFRDLDQNGPDNGDALDFIFGEDLSCGSPGPGHFAITTGSFGTTASAACPGGTPRVVRITLGNLLDLDQIRFAPGSGKGTPNTVNLNAPTPQITDAAGALAQPAPNPLDIHPGFTNTQTLGSAASLGALAADLNGDGDLDLVFANGSGGADRVWNNDGTGSFSAGATLGTTNSRAVTGADFDRDGDIDLVFATASGEANRFYANVGNATFMPPVTLNTVNARGVASADVDHNGFDDVVFATGGGIADQVWLNDRSTPFPAATSLGNATDARDVAIGDLDGDGWPDLLFAVFGADDQIFLNDGSGGFTSGGDLNDGDESLSVALGDIDRDGDLDAVVGNTSAQPNTVWFNDGTASFGAAVALASTNADDVALLDVDLDGDLDLALALSGTPSEIWLNDGTGALSYREEDLGVGGQGLTVGDFDASGDLDLILARSGPANEVFLSSSAGSIGSLAFDPSPPLAGAPASISRADAYGLADLDSDGDNDLAVASSTIGGCNPVLLWTGSNFADSGQCVGRPSGSLEQSFAISVADFDLDGDIDAGVGDASTVTGRVEVFSNSGGNPVPIFVDEIRSLGTGAARTLAMTSGDIGRDGTIDIVVGHERNVGGEGEQVWLNGDPSMLDFGAAPTQTLASSDLTQTVGVVLVDMDGDGYLDIVVGNRAFGAAPTADDIWLYNSGSGMFSNSYTIASVDTRGLIAGDINLDGSPDVIIGRSNGFQLYLNRDDGTGRTAASAAQTVTGEPSTNDVVLADVDHDGDLDLLIATASGVAVWIYDRSGGTFSSFGGFPSLGACGAIGAADLDGDGDIDVVADDGALGTRVVLNLTR